MTRNPAVILLLSCFTLAFAKHQVIHPTRLLSSRRDLAQNNGNPYNQQFESPSSKDDVDIKPPTYLKSLLNQLLDVKGGGHDKYLNVFPSSWSTNQVNNQLTVDVQFTALVNSETEKCSARISAVMPPSNGNPTIAVRGSTLTCKPGNEGTEYSRPLPNNVYGVPPLVSDPYQQPPLQQYPAIPEYYEPQQVVYSTKLVPITVQTLVPLPPKTPALQAILPEAPLGASPYGPGPVFPNEFIVPAMHYIY